MVAGLAVFETRALQVVPPSADLSILYPVMAEPPLSEGTVQLKLIWEEETDVAVGAPGEDGATANVVADALLEVELVPTELRPETL